MANNIACICKRSTFFVNCKEASIFFFFWEAKLRFIIKGLFKSAKNTEARFGGISSIQMDIRRVMDALLAREWANLLQCLRTKDRPIFENWDVRKKTYDGGFYRGLICCRCSSMTWEVSLRLPQELHRRNQFFLSVTSIGLFSPSF